MGSASDRDPLSENCESRSIHCGQMNSETSTLDLEEAIQEMEEAMAFVPADDPDQGQYLDELAQLFMERYVVHGKLADLDAAVSWGTQAVATTPECHERYPGLLNNLSNSLNSRFMANGNIIDLSLAVEHAQKATELAPMADPERATYLGTYAAHLSTRYAITNARDDLNRVIMLMEEVLEILPEDSPLRPIHLNNYGFNLWVRYNSVGKPEDLETSIARLAEAVASLPLPDKRLRGKVLASFASSLLTNSIMSYDESDLDLALSSAEESVQLTDADHSERGQRLSILGSCLERMYHTRFDLEYLHRAILVVQEAVIVTHKGHIQWPSYVNKLGTYLSMRYGDSRDLEDLDAAIRCIEDAIDAMMRLGRSGGYDIQIAWYLKTLAIQYAQRAERTGQIMDLDSAVNTAEMAVQISMGQEDPIVHPDCLSDLAKHLMKRYLGTQNTADLGAAIQRAMESLHETIPEHRHNEDYASRVGNLAGFLYYRYQRNDKMEDLDAAVHLQTYAVELSRNTLQYPSLLNSLSVVLQCKFTITGERSDLEAAVTSAREALACVPHNDRIVSSACASNLAASQGELAVLTSQITVSDSVEVNLMDLDKLIEGAQQSVDSCPADHPNFADVSFNLGSPLIRRFWALGDVGDLERGIEGYYRAWNCLGAPLPSRLEAANWFGAKSLHHPKPDLGRVWSVLREAVELIPIATARWLARSDQRYILSMLPSMASLAAAVAIEVGQSPMEALRLLEIGRCVTSGHLLDYRSDLRALKLAHPELGTQLEKLFEEADSPGDSFDVERRRTIFREIDQIIAEIRHLPTFESFLQTGSGQDMMSHVATYGPVVVLNVTELRSDAILITKQAIQVVPLPGLNNLTAQSHLRKLNEAVRSISLSSLKQTNDDLREVWLPWLWHEAVRPVLQALGLMNQLETGMGNQKLKRKLGRVWWTGVGPLATAPLHAAGVYTEQGSANPESTLKYCIPSYTPSVRALMHSRRNATLSPVRGGDSESLYSSVLPPPNHDLLIVSMPTTPGNTPLNVEKETNEIQKIVPLFKHLHRPNVQEVLKELPKHSMVHFACHGIADQWNPSGSALLLVNENPSTGAEQLDTLSVEMISSLHLTSARVAYLSACSTAELHPDSRIVDEVIHIASSFQLAGFGHVIGTLWETDDGACVEMAREYYKQLVGLSEKRVKGSLDPSNLDIARAYRESVLMMRKKYPLRPLSWVPYIHLGA